MPKLNKNMSRAQDRALRMAAARYKGDTAGQASLRAGSIALSVGLSYGRIHRSIQPWRIVYRERKNGKIKRFSYGRADMPPGHYVVKLVDTYIDAFCRLVQVIEVMQ